MHELHAQRPVHPRRCATSARPRQGQQVAITPVRRRMGGGRSTIDGMGQSAMRWTDRGQTLIGRLQAIERATASSDGHPIERTIGLIHQAAAADLHDGATWLEQAQRPFFHSPWGGWYMTPGLTLRPPLPPYIPCMASPLRFTTRASSSMVAAEGAVGATAPAAIGSRSVSFDRIGRLGCKGVRLDALVCATVDHWRIFLLGWQVMGK